MSLLDSVPLLQVDSSKTELDIRASRSVNSIGMCCYTLTSVLFGLISIIKNIVMSKLGLAFSTSNLNLLIYFVSFSYLCDSTVKIKSNQSINQVI